MSDTEKLREQNDAFRRTLAGGVVEWDRSLRFYSTGIKRGLLRRIQNFKRWKTDNGHESTHDFGYFYSRWCREWIFWAIHYQDARDISLPSPDPTDPFVTQRLLMIALAPHDYDDGGDEDEGDDAEPELGDPPR